MTTVATDGKVVAADSQLTGDYIEPTPVPKLWAVGKSVVACAGVYTSCLKFVEWARAGFAPDAKPEISEDFAALVVDAKRVQMYDDALVPMKLGRVVAIGSGGQIAMGAMLAGATPKKAVEIAKRLDRGTGGKVVTMDVPK